MAFEDIAPLLPTAHRRARNSRAGSMSESLDVSCGSPVSHTTAERHKDKKRFARFERLSSIPLIALAGVLVCGFVMGYYTQLLLFFCRVRLGFQATVLPIVASRLVPHDSEETYSLLHEPIQRVLFVCDKTNWDFVGFIVSPETLVFAHKDVSIPLALENSLQVVRHTGVDSYLNLHNKTVTIMSHIQATNARSHLLKQDDEAVIYWPQYYQCLQQCTDLAACYAGDMHVNVGGVSNTNSYVFATGGSYFVGSGVIKCILDNPIYVELEGLDYGEDKTVGKMIHYNKCNVEYVSCKWFNNEEVYLPHAHVKMTKGAATAVRRDTILVDRERYLQVTNGGRGNTVRRLDENDEQTRQDGV
ncbi:unnamed protein product [Hyaloperonospora brassicae]|uniref:Uncharacterized protein n=1 Tax=Hyaloperonospora brassicae TaxID=162125 RepID=A0AAV0URH2_HYABA|nr:unnamed protein product [Hyaloperonospora brassicae]